MGMHRDQARRAAGRARIAALGLAAVGGVVLFAPFPKLDAAPATGGSGGTIAGPTTPAAKQAPAFDPELASRVLTDAGPDARPPAVAEAEPAPEADPDPLTEEASPAPGTVETAAGGPALRYLGPIVGPRRTLAMVALDGQQHIVAIGEEIDGKVIKTVLPTQIVLDDHQGVEHIVARAEQVLDWSMDAPAPTPKAGFGSKKLPGPAGKLGANGADRNEHPDDLATGPDAEAKRAEAARRLAEERASEEHNAGNPNANNPPRPNRPVPPGSPIPKVPLTRGVAPASPSTTTPPKYPPARPAAPGSNTVPGRVPTGEKKAGNSA